MLPTCQKARLVPPAANPISIPKLFRKCYDDYCEYQYITCASRGRKGDLPIFIFVTTYFCGQHVSMLCILHLDMLLTALLGWHMVHSTGRNGKLNQIRTFKSSGSLYDYTGHTFQPTVSFLLLYILLKEVCTCKLTINALFKKHIDFSDFLDTSIRLQVVEPE